MKILFGFVILFFIIACDPPQVLIAKNQTKQVIDFHVKTRDTIHFDSLWYSETLIPNDSIKFNTISKYFDKKLNIDSIDPWNYKFKLKPNQEVVFSPVTIGLAFESIRFHLNEKPLEITSYSNIENDHIEIARKKLSIWIVNLHE